LHYFAKKQKQKPPKTEELILRLRSAGFKAVRTHLCPTAIKTDANFKDFKKEFASEIK